MNSDHGPHRHYYRQSEGRHNRQPQHNYHPSPVASSIVRQTPPSAQHYAGSVTSVNRQERFRQVQQGYYPESTCYPSKRENAQSRFPIGLDYVDDDFRSPTPLVLDPSRVTPLPQQSTATKQETKSGMVHSLLKGIRGPGSSPARHEQPRHTPNHFSPSQPHAPPHQSASNARNPQPPILHHHPQPPTATDLARRAPHAGFLQKLGSNIPTYKRRFFVLQPSTQLYYFVSPHDTTPRGAIAIDEARVERLEDLPDGRSRLALHWPDGRSMHLEARSPDAADEWCQALQKERLQTVKAQLEESQQQCAEAQGEIQDLKKQIENFRFVEQDRDGALEDARRWKEQFEALDEALRLLANHVRQLPLSDQEKNDAVKSTQGEEGATSDDENKGDAAAEAMNTVEKGVEQKGESLPRETGSGKAKGEEFYPTPVKEKPAVEKGEESNQKPTGDADKNEYDEPSEENIKSVSRRDISLLDDDVAVEEAVSKLVDKRNVIEELTAPGHHFSALINACQQLRENLRLASEEAATAVEDTKAAQNQAKALQARMAKAEKQLCQLWEENCSIRKTLKQKKREKRVLVREVKSLMEQQQQQQQRQILEQQQRRTNAPMLTEDDASTIMGSDEERLFNELEEHLASSIKMHEEFLSGGSSVKGKVPKHLGPNQIRGKQTDDGTGVPSSSSTVTTSMSTHSGMGPTMTRESTTSTTSTAVVRHVPDRPRKSKKPVPEEAPIASLFDRSASESDSELEENQENDPCIPSDPPQASQTMQGVAEIGFPRPVYDEMDGRSISSVAASFGGNSAGERSRRSTPLLPNPVLQLDFSEDKSGDDMDERKHFKPINIAKPGQATSKLVCPLADVVKTRPRVGSQQVQTPASCRQDELQIYHLTFYTRKIGLQFQKVPAPPTRSRGLLTDAMTADLAVDAHGSSKTAAELKRVAAISTWAKPSNVHAHAGETDTDATLHVALPVDAVLVCGFEGFDDSGNNVRPKLGARLVAFDGVSVEVGKWTFDSIRKAIQSRGRPLTLSFRNDFLTTDQRTIMTRAVEQLEQLDKEPPLATPASLYDNSKPCGSVVKNEQPAEKEDTTRPPSLPSVPSAPSHETELFVNETTFRTSNVLNFHEKGHPKRWEDEDDDLTVSTTGYCSSDYHHPNHPRPGWQPRRPTNSSGGSYNGGRMLGHGNYRSFSEAGSSASALSSAIGPLMSNLMSGLSSEKKRVNMAPDYLSRRASVESTPQHQDFQSNLL